MLQTYWGKKKKSDLRIVGKRGRFSTGHRGKPSRGESPVSPMCVSLSAKASKRVSSPRGGSKSEMAHTCAAQGRVLPLGDLGRLPLVPGLGSRAACLESGVIIWNRVCLHYNNNTVSVCLCIGGGVSAFLSVFVFFAGLKAHRGESGSLAEGDVQAWPGSGGLCRNARWLQSPVV